LQLVSEVSPFEGFWEEAETVLYVDPEAGDDLNGGATDAPLRTLGKALELVQPGWHIRLRTGVYQEAAETVRPGRPDAPIVIEPDINHSPVLDGDSHRMGALQVEHSYYTIRGLEFRDFYEGFKIYHSTGVIVEHNYIHDISAECVFVKDGSHDNIVRNNTVHDCGLDENGEGIYIGTAPENRELRNDGLPDINLRNIVTGNIIYRVTEGVDIKEDSSLNVVSLNYIYDTTEEGTGGINVRGDENFIYDNLVESNEGSGIRLGGDLASHPEYEEDYRYGGNNVLRGNISRNNEQYGYKLMVGPQVFDVTNIGFSNDKGLLRNPQFILAVGSSQEE
jgi:hypothetical protein